MTATREMVGSLPIPDGWQRVRLGDMADVVMGQSPPGELVVDWRDEAQDIDGLPFVQGNAEFGTKYPNPVKWCIQPFKVGIPGDVLISVRAPVGETNRVATPLGIGRGLAAVRFDKKSQQFGWHLFNHWKGALDRVTQGSTFAAIGGGELRSLSILLPPLPEQRAIAAVLDSIDDAIEGAEAVIAATEGLRNALLHEPAHPRPPRPARRVPRRPRPRYHPGGLGGGAAGGCGGGTKWNHAISQEIRVLGRRGNSLREDRSG